MVPTTFTLTCEKLCTRAGNGSWITNAAVFGGAAVPLLTGAVADVPTMALAPPALCHGVIAAYGLLSRKPLFEDV